MKSRVFLSSLLIVIALILTFLVAKSIMRPAKFSEVYNERISMNENRMTIISELQKMYRKENGEFATNVDQLVNFYEKGSFIVTSLQKNVDSIPEKLSMEEAEAQGFYKRIETKILVKDKMKDILDDINKQKSSPIEMKDFQYIPYGDNQQKYEINICHTDSAAIKYAIYIPVDVLLQNFDRSLLPEDANIFLRATSSLLYKDLLNESLYYKKLKGGAEEDYNMNPKWTGLQLGDTVKYSEDIIRINLPTQKKNHSEE